MPSDLKSLLLIKHLTYNHIDIFETIQQKDKMPLDHPLLAMRGKLTPPIIIILL